MTLLRNLICANWAWMLLQIKGFKYLEVLFTSEGMMECEINQCIDAASTVAQKKRELSLKAKLAVYHVILKHSYSI